MSRVVQSIDDFSDDEFDDFDDADLCALDEAEKAYLAAKASERQQQLLHQNPHPLPQPQQHQEPNEEKRKCGQRHYQEPQQNKGRNMQSGRHQHGRSDTLRIQKRITTSVGHFECELPRSGNARYKTIFKRYWTAGLMDQTNGTVLSAIFNIRPLHQIAPNVSMQSARAVEAEASAAIGMANWIQKMQSSSR